MPQHKQLPYSSRPVPPNMNEELWKAYASWLDEPNKNLAKIKFQQLKQIKNNQLAYAS